MLITMCVGAWVNAWNTFQYPSHRANASEMGEGFKSAAEYIFVPHSRRVYLAMINLQWSPRNSCQARAANVQFTAIEAMQNAGTVNTHESAVQVMHFPRVHRFCACTVYTNSTVQCSLCNRRQLPELAIAN